MNDLMNEKRRLLLVGSTSALFLTNKSVDAHPITSPLHKIPYVYRYVDYWSQEQLRAYNPKLFGTKPQLVEDREAADAIIAAAPRTTPVEVMRYFAAQTQLGSTGEPFNQRWKTYENPIIVWFFHSTNTVPNGDCTSWCAAFLSYCLERCGFKSRHSASSQSYKNYGAEATAPRVGDIVVFQNVGDQSHGHVALYLADAGLDIKVIGGNQGHGADIPSCPKGFPVTTISEALREKRGKEQIVLTIRQPEVK